MVTKVSLPIRPPSSISSHVIRFEAQSRLANGVTCLGGGIPMSKENDLESHIVREKATDKGRDVIQETTELPSVVVGFKSMSQSVVKVENFLALCRAKGVTERVWTCITD